MGKRKHHAIVCLLVMAVQLVPAPAWAEGWPFGGVQLSSAPMTTVQQLAAQIDKLQRHLDKHGTIVAKDPDVWGQSRLMTHRVEFEEEVKLRLHTFDAGRLNAAEFTRDSAFLSQAIQLQTAISGQPAPATGGAVPNQAVSVSYAAPLLEAGKLTGSVPNTETELVPRTGFSTGFQTIKGSGEPAIAIGLEQTIELDQLKRYLEHLNEIRRLNEGDDTADSPGYALHMMRIPVSVLPGKETHEGYGAEITMAIKPQLSEQLLPDAFRDFVINGVRDRISAEVLYLADQEKPDVLRTTLQAYYAAANEKATIDNLTLPSISGGIDRVVWQQASPPADEKTARGIIEDFAARKKVTLDPKVLNDIKPGSSFFELKAITDAVDKKSQQEPGANATVDAQDVKNEKTKPESHAFADLFTQPGGRNGSLSVSWTHMKSLNGHTLYRVALDAFQLMARSEIALKDTSERDKIPAGRRHLNFPDVEAFVVDETKAAYALLTQPAALSLWSAHCTPDLARTIREFRRQENQQDFLEVGTIRDLRDQFFSSIKNCFPQAKDSTTASLAWHIIVESALLNEQLLEDMKKVAAEKNAFCLNVDWMPFYGPCPSPEARAVFNQYVMCRWPIHVFALDPVTQDQNVASGFSRRREMQLVLALSAANRALSLQSLTQFVRRLEYDLETIDLNRTAIGFTHGGDTFGWRFYPRVQAPPVESNAKVAIRDLIIGGPNRNDDLGKRRLEPGIRECTALVVMPSFVPYVTLDTHSTWFKLADHHGSLPPRILHRKGELRNAVDLSADIVSLRQLSQACAADAHLYRDGEVYRLQRVVEKLDRALPLQTAMVEMPYENLLGGFELFNSSVLGLKPTLRGWYGAPGIVVSDLTDVPRNLGAYLTFVQQQRAAMKVALDELKASPNAAEPRMASRIAELDAQLTALNGSAEAALKAYQSAQNVPLSNTTVYLIGKHFSVVNTRVIAGGAALADTDVKVISRDVIQVTIPSTVSTVKEDGRRWVDVHLATPYGPTPRLRIPVADELGESIIAAGTNAQKYAAEAKKAAEQAVASSPAISWSDAKYTLTYSPWAPCCLDWNGASKAAIHHLHSSPFTDPVQLELACYLSVRNKGETTAKPIPDRNGVRKSVLVGELQGNLSQKNLTTYDLDLLLKKVNEELSGLTGVPEEIVVEGYVRGVDHPAGTRIRRPDSLPIVALGKLTLTVIAREANPRQADSLKPSDFRTGHWPQTPIQLDLSMPFTEGVSPLLEKSVLSP